MRTITLMSWLMAFYYIIHHTNAFSEKGIIAYDCSDDKINITTLSLNDIEPCSTELSNITTSSVRIQVLQARNHFDVKALQCKVVYKREIFHCGWQSYMSAMANSYKYIMKDMTTEECKRIHETGVLNVYNEIHIHSLRRNITNKGKVTISGSIEGSTCTGSTYFDGSETFNNVVVQYEYEITLKVLNGIYDVNKNEIVFKSGLTCPYDEFNCIDSIDGFYAWSNAISTDCLDSKFSVLYEGYANKTSSDENTYTQNRALYTAISSDHMFHIQAQEKRDLCGNPGFSTDHTNIFIIEVTQHTHLIRHHKAHAKDLDIFMYFNSKISLVENHIKNQLIGLYREMIYKTCQVERELMMTQLTLARKNPQEFASTIMKKPGFTAVNAGEVIYIIQCVPVYVTIMPTDLCYQEIPVKLGDDLRYLSPVTRILQRHATEIECSPLLMSKFKFGDRWFNFDSRVIEVLGPKTLSPQTAHTWKYESLPSLINGGIYDKNNMKKMHDMIYEHDDQRSATNLLHRVISGKHADHQNFQIESLVKEDYIDHKIKTLWLKFLSFSTVFGQVTSSMIGLWLLGKTIKYVIDSVVHGKVLYDIYGFSWRLLAAFWDSLALCMTHRYLYRHRDNTPSEEPAVPVDTKDKVERTQHTSTNHVYPIVYSIPTPNAPTCSQAYDSNGGNYKVDY